MGLKIADLLKFRTEVTLLHPDTGKPIQKDGEDVVVYLRLIGDDDVEKSHRAARLISAEFRKQLRDKNSETYKDRVEPIWEATKEQCLVIIQSSRTSNLEAEARSAVERPDLPEIDEFAVDPDAPSLEEQEKLDAEIDKLDAEYKKAIEDYVETKTSEIMAEFENMSEEEVRKVAAEEISNVLALSEFFNELMDQKIFRGAYIDRTLKTKAFDTLQDFKDAHTSIKQQLIEAYIRLEIDPESLKNS